MQDKPTNPGQQTPADIAREAIRRLAIRRIPPTPEAYREIYDEVAGTFALTPAENVLVEFAASLADAPPDIASFSSRIQRAIEERNWKHVGKQLQQLRGKYLSPPEAGKPEPQAHGTSIEVKEAPPDHIISIPLVDDAPVMAPSPSIQLVDDDKSGNDKNHDEHAASDVLASSDGMDILPPLGEPPHDPSMTVTLRAMLVRTLDYVLASLLNDAPALAKESERLASAIHQARTRHALSEIEPQLKEFCFKAEMKSGDLAEERELLLRLFRLLIENIGELLEDDSWLSGQIANVQEILSGPINYASLMDATRSMKEVIYKQSMLKHSLAEAKARTKTLMLTTMEKLGTLADSTESYQQKIETFSKRVSVAEGGTELNKVLDELIGDTRIAHIEAVRSHDELVASRNEIQAAESRIHELESELKQMSNLVREDQLTGSLNRRGLDEVLQREMEHALRRKSRLCIAMVDIDNFKKLNDTYGHTTGDQALVHLVRVIKDTLRAMDILARFGGEEFMIVLPDTALEEAAQIVTRVQRELTKRFFLHNNDRLLITFSSGVAMFTRAESQTELIQRADDALYKAKQAGKNRVVTAEQPPH
jgi:diguanylate cyclase